MPLGVGRNTASLSTILHLLSKGGGDNLPELVDSAGIKELRVATNGCNEDIVRQHREEVSGKLGAAGVQTVEGSREDSRFARGVELEVHLTLREDHAAVVGQSGINLANRASGVLAIQVTCATRVLLENQAADKLTLHNSEELVGTRVQVRRVEAAGVNKANAHGDVGSNKRRKRVDTSNGDGTTSRGLDRVVEELVGDVAGIRDMGK
jgi:hypothetical protein